MTLLLAQLPGPWPSSETFYQFLGLCAVLLYMAYQNKITKGLGRQINGRMENLLQANWDAAHAKGRIAGAQEEQERIKIKLATSDAVTLRLLEVKSNDPDKDHGAGATSP
jgi:hypothetical protein